MWVPPGRLCILKCYEFGIRLEGLEAGSGVFHHSCVCIVEGGRPGTPLFFASSFIGKAFRNVWELKVSQLPLACSFCGSLDFSSSFFFYCDFSPLQRRNSLDFCSHTRLSQGCLWRHQLYQTHHLGAWVLSPAGMAVLGILGEGFVGIGSRGLTHKKQPGFEG